MRAIIDKEVTPLAGVWIEIMGRTVNKVYYLASLPLRECGLKCLTCMIILMLVSVTPLAGVWIEIADFCCHM